MKSTGIVRGIDALGRIVLPKELRTSMKLESDGKARNSSLMETPSSSKVPPEGKLRLLRDRR